MTTDTNLQITDDTHEILFKALCNYLPYNLKCHAMGEHVYGTEYDDKPKPMEFVLHGFVNGKASIMSVQKKLIELDELFPILRPLSDLTKEDWKEELLMYYADLDMNIQMTEYDSGNKNPNDFTLAVSYKMMGEAYTDLLVMRGRVKESPYYFVKWLHENHFDTENLIEKGLAINKNKL